MKVAVVGTGLIGGSLGLALRRAGLRVRGYDADADRLARALARGVVDDAAPSLLDAFAGADVAFVAVPVSGVAAAVAAALDAGVGAVSDVGSVKAPVVRAVEAAQPPGAAARFVGGHPMAGSADEGIEAAAADLFDGATWVLTPTATTDPAAFTAVRDLVALTGAEIVAVDPDLHDGLVATVSHLPHLAASALMHVAADAQPNHETLLRLAAGGFRALTRLSGRSAGIWPDICVENRTAIVDVLDRYVKELERVRDLVAAAATPAGAGAVPALPAELSFHGPRPLRGRLRVPGDKSISHRALLFSALASGTSRLWGLADGDDVVRTRAAIEALGAKVRGGAGSPAEAAVAGERADPVVIVRGAGFDGLAEPETVLDCGNSGTSIRLLAGLLSGRPFHSVLTGDVSIARRPMGRVVDPLRAMGARIDGREGGRLAPLAIRGGGLTGMRHELPMASAQVKTALLLAGLQAAGVTEVTEPALSRDHTERLLPAMGAMLEPIPGGVRVSPAATGGLTPINLAVPGDPSAAAFFVVGAC